MLQADKVVIGQRALAPCERLVAADAEDERVGPRAGTCAILEEAIVQVILLGPANSRPPLVHHLAAEEVGEARASDGALVERVVQGGGIASVSAGAAEKCGETCERARHVSTSGIRRLGGR